MIRFVRDFKIVPLVLVATISLFGLKMLGIMFDGGYLFGGHGGRGGDDTDVTGSIAAPARNEPPSEPPPPPEPARPSWAQQMFNYPDVTGSVGEVKPPQETPPVKANPPPAKPADGSPGGWTPVPVDNSRQQSPAERAILERLQDRRAEIDARGRELDMRESLLKAAEKRLEGRIAELKDIEARVTGAVKQKDSDDAARFKNLVTMYENMKAKDAAKIFDRLDMRVLIEVATQINPRRMSDVLAQMAPEAAERLTVELAARAVGKDKNSSADLPKIEGKPTGN